MHPAQLDGAATVAQLPGETLVFRKSSFTLLCVQIGVRRIFRVFSVISIVGAGTLVAPAFFGTPASATTPTTVTQTFGFDSDALQNFTVPSDVTSLTITATGGQGGWGGADNSGNPPAGGYQGQVSGTISVTPGDYLTIGVGAGADEPYNTACTGGRDEQSPVDAYDAAAGVNPLVPVRRRHGRRAGLQRLLWLRRRRRRRHRRRGRELGQCADQRRHHRGGWRRRRRRIGSVRAGAGPDRPGVLRAPDDTHADHLRHTGRLHDGLHVPQHHREPDVRCRPIPPRASPGSPSSPCAAVTRRVSNADQFFTTSAPNSEAGCDGGGGAGGGGGAAGGSAGNDEFGSGTSDEWYGQGGSPGENSTGGLTGLSADLRLLRRHGHRCAQRDRHLRRSGCGSSTGR